MEKQMEPQKSLGQAIDEIIRALSSLDEPSRTTAIRAACEHMKIGVPSLAESKTSMTAVTSTLAPYSASKLEHLPDIKELKEQKQPSSANEMSALVAYYLSEIALAGDHKDEVELEDIVRYFKQAKFPLPKRPEFLLPNAKYAGYFDSVGNGKYKLNPVGYNLIAHNLPRLQSKAPKVSRGSTKFKRRK